jgi:hypothetical protein
MESFGDPSEYDFAIIRGQKREERPAVSQATLDFESSGAREAD